MNWFDMGQLALTLGLGGTIGAMIALAVAGKRTADAVEEFALILKNHVTSGSEMSGKELVQAFEKVRLQTALLGEALTKAKKALRWH